MRCEMKSGGGLGMGTSGLLHGYMLASFPDRSRLQFLIAYCMQKRSKTGGGNDLGTRLATCSASSALGARPGRAYTYIYGTDTELE